MNSDIDMVVDRAVIAGRLDNIAKEMGVVLEKSARSPIFAEACDFSCGITDAEGELISQLSGIPILAAAGSYSVKAILHAFGEDISPGDIFILNDPFHGGNHLPDIGIITPFFFEGELTCFSVSRAHHGDIGGSAAGSYNAKATEIFQEGLRIPPLRIAKNDRLIEDVIYMIAHNTRNPEMIKNDLMAQVGANRIGNLRLKSMVETYGIKKLKKVIKDLLIQGKTMVRSYVKKLPDGEYFGEEYVDDDGFQEEPIRIAVKTVIDGDRVLLDFTGTDKQVIGFINTSFVTASTAARIAFLWTLGPDIPRNGGSFSAIDVILPEGSLLNPHMPAPMTLCTLTPAGEIISAVFKSMENIAAENVPAGFARYCGPSFFGIDPRYGNMYVGFSFCSLGAGGAMPGADGKPYMSPMSNFGGVRTPDIESNEIQYPHLTLSHEMETDTAGPGKWRGGAGLHYSMTFYDHSPGIVNFGDGMKIPPYGLKGGLPGRVCRMSIKGQNGEERVLSSKEGPIFLKPGEILSMHTAGGGGYGSPSEREKEDWEEDIENEIFSRENVMKFVLESEGGRA